MTNQIDNFDRGEILNDDEKIEVKKNERTIIYESLNPDIKTLYDNWKNGDLLLQPDFQRNFVWDERKASNLIESVLLKIPIPIIYTAEDNGYEEVVDGQQRLTSIFSYIDGRFPDGKTFRLRKLKILTELSGKNFVELPEILKKSILKRGLSVIKISSQSNDDIKFEMFERLNTNITKLNAQELRNCMYHGEYNTFIKNLSRNHDFQYILNKPDISKRMYDCELVLLFLAFCNKNFERFKGSMNQFLNDDMRIKRNIGSDEKIELEEIFNKSVELIRVIWGKNAFYTYSMVDLPRYNFPLEGKYDSKVLNQGLFLILMYGFINYSKNQIIPFSDLIREELFNLQIHNTDFRNSLTGSGTNSKRNIIIKMDIWRETLKGILGYPNNEPRSFTQKLKLELFERNCTCNICKQRILKIDDSEIDHITCYWKGGKTIPENAQLVHRICNRIKGGNDT